MCGHLPGRAAGAALTGLRVLLVTDVVARTAEMFGVTVLTAVVTGAAGDDGAAPRAGDIAALGIRPAPAWPDDQEAGRHLGGPPGVHVTGPAPASDPDSGGIVVGVGGVREAGRGGAGAPADGIGLAGAPDPLAVRFALLSVPADQPVILTAAAVADAASTLRQWRLLVAGWAEEPSRPMPAAVRERLREALGGLRTRTALDLLADLAADEATPPGAKFETFAYADLVLGLELVRDIGGPRP